LGEEHMRTGKPIVYTSADSVFQIAANEAIIPIEELYKMCKISREMLQGEHAVGRVIARPFVGTSASNFKRTERRHDYPLMSPLPTMLDRLVSAGKDVVSVGKIDDIFGHRGITRSNHTVSNRDGIAATLEFLPEEFEGMLFVNLIEFDMIFGHRNDARGYADALEEFDRAVPEIQKRIKSSDLVMVVADHGVDPTTPGTDHSREHIPLLVFGEQIKQGKNLGTRKTFSDVATTIGEIFSIPDPILGESFYKDLQ
jgi:phosphopentomutase